MTSFEMQGTVIHIGEREHKSNDFCKQDIVLKIPDDRYPQEILFEFHQNRCDQLAHIALNETITVHFDIRGRAWNDRWFNSLVGWKVTKHGQQTGTPKPEPTAESTVADQNGASSENSGDGDLPF